MVKVSHHIVVRYCHCSTLLSAAKGEETTEAAATAVAARMEVARGVAMEAAVSAETATATEATARGAAARAAAGKWPLLSDIVIVRHYCPILSFSKIWSEFVRMHQII